MRTRSLLLAAFAAALTAAGQEPAPPAPQAYRLDFAIHEL